MVNFFKKDQTRYSILLGYVAILVILILLHSSCNTNRVTKKPNIIFILADDLGIGRFKAAIENLPASSFTKEMEHRDKSMYSLEKSYRDGIKSISFLTNLAKDGLYFSNAFVSSSWCSPSRFSILTGKYPQKDHIWISSDVMVGAVKEETRFLTELFQENGYATAAIGKWHLGNGKARGGMKPHQHPNKKGFDYYFGFDKSGTKYYNSSILYRNTTKVKPDGFLTDQLSNEAINFITKNKEKPFFLYLPYNAPHGPLYLAPKGYYRHFDKEKSFARNNIKTREVTDTLGTSTINNYNSHIYAMDFGIRRIQQLLFDLNIDDNTIIVFTSDHGASGFATTPLPANSPYKGYKGQIEEGAMRVPLIFWGPGVIKNKGICDKMVMSFDIIPTLLKLAGISIPSSFNIDGKNISTYLYDDLKNVEEVHDHLVWAGLQTFNQCFQTNFKGLGKINYPNIHPGTWMIRNKNFTLRSNVIDGLQLTSNNFGDNTNYLSSYPEETKYLFNKYKLWFDNIAKKPLVFQETWDDTHYIHDQATVKEL